MTSGKAPDFELGSLAGDVTSLAALLQAGPVLLAFYKGTCPTCQLTFPFLQRLHLGKTPDAPQVVAISQDDFRATADFSRTFGLTFPVLIDPREEVASRYPASNAYGITNVPSLFLVESDGSISQSFAGFDKAEMQRLGKRFGVEVFEPGERVPVFRPG